MKSSWKILRKISQSRAKDKTPISYEQPAEDAEEITRKMKKVKELRKFYEGLHKVSSHAASQARGFSEAVHDMGKYFISNNGVMDDGSFGNMLRIMGKSQLDIARFLDLYAANVSNLLTIPIENTLYEIQVAEDTKLKYDEKRGLYDDLCSHFAKGRHKNRKGEIDAEQQLQQAKRQFDEVALNMDCRVLSLVQGHFENVITKVSRLHNAQMHLFRKCFSSANKIEPFMDLLSQERKIDRQIHFGRHHSNSDDERDPNGNQVAASNENDDSTKLRSLEQIPIQEKIIDDDHWTARSPCAKVKLAHSSPTNSPEHGIAETFQELLRETSLENNEISPPTTPSWGPNLKEDQGLPHSTISCGALSTSPPTVRSIRTEEPTELQNSYTKHSQLQVMPEHTVTEYDSSMLTIPEFGVPSPTKSHIGIQEHVVKPLPHFSASVSVPLPPLLTREKSTSFKLDTRNLPQFSKKHGSSPTPLLKKRYSHSGPLDALGNPWSADKFAMPSPILVPPSSKVYSEAFFKSGGLGRYGEVRPFLSPRTPPCSPPHVSELYKLPSPPISDSQISSKQDFASPQFSQATASHAAPLPLPPQKSESQALSSSPSPERVWKTQHIKSPKHPLSKQTLEE